MFLLTRSDNSDSKKSLYIEGMDNPPADHPLSCIWNQLEDDDDTILDMSAQVHTAYKHVDRKVKPVPGVFPEDASVIRQIPEDPLKTLPPLPQNPPAFKEPVRLTKER